MHQPRTLKAIALLLDYPEAALLEHLPEIEAIIGAEGLLKSDRALLDPFFAYLRGVDIYQLQENYVALFDRGRGTSLHLFEHVHGESRDRGQAMVDLLEMYHRSGFDLGASELPDYLPAFLEYLAQIDPPQAHALLQEIAHLIQNITQNIARRGSHYYYLCAALLRVAGEAPSEVSFVAQDIAAEPEDLEKLDAAWEEAPVTFGGNCAAAYDQKSGEAVVQFVPREKAQRTPMA